MSYWEKNLAILKARAPELARILTQTVVPPDHKVIPSKSGPPYLQVGGVRLHSTYQPVAEGRSWAQAQEREEKEPVVIFGLGLGYHVLPFLEEDRMVWVVEPSAPVARLAMEHQDLTRLWERGGLCVGQNITGLPPKARLLVHAPTRRLHPGLCQRLAAYLAGEEQRGGQLRILVVGPLYGGSHAIARFSARAFSDMGHEAEFLDFAPFHPGFKALGKLSQVPKTLSRLTKECLRFLGEILLTRVRELHPDLVFFLAQAPVDPPLLRTLRGEGPLLAYWFVEDYQVFPYWREVAPEVDAFFVLQREGFFQELSKLGLKNFGFLPLATDPEVYRPLALEPSEQKQYGSAVSFVGAGYRNRREFFQGFMDLDFKIWGSDWDLASPLAPYIQNRGARVSEEEAVKIFNATKINLNLHSSPYHQGINPDGEYLNPRVFDLAAAGAFQLVDWRSQLPEFFVPEEEVATFTSLLEAREKLDYYLAHEEKRREVAQRGRERCLRDHTYRLRLTQALEILEDLCPGRLTPRPLAESPVEQLKRLFPAEHPVQSFLKQLPPEVETLDQVVNHLKEGESALSETEALFWLLHEFQSGLKRGRF